MSEEEDNIEVLEPETYATHGEALSPSQIVLSAMHKCIEAGSQEMKEGHTVMKRDKFGNQLPIYLPDTRLVFIECIETYKMTMGAHLDKEAEDKLKEITIKLNETFNKYLFMEAEEWKRASVVVQNDWRRRGIVLIPGKLNKQMSYYNEYLLDKVQIYRELYVELDKLLKRLNYLQEESYEA